jgi:peptide/nickel transport system permease protein
VVLMRITDIFLSFPSLVLALAFSAALGPGIENAVIAIALTVWPPIARLARAETMTFRQADFVVAAELQGAGMARILFRHIVPLCAPSIIIRLTLNMSSVILTAAGLGFLGLGSAAANAGVGCHGSFGTTIFARRMVADDGARLCHPPRQPRFQSPWRWLARYHGSSKCLISLNRS